MVEQLLLQLQKTFLKVQLKYLGLRKVRMPYQKSTHGLMKNMF